MTFIVQIVGPNGAVSWVTVSASNSTEARKKVQAGVEQGFIANQVFTADTQGVQDATQAGFTGTFADIPSFDDPAQPDIDTGPPVTPPPPADLGPGELPGEFGADFPRAAFLRGLKRRGEAGSANTILRRLLESDAPLARGTLRGSEFAQAFRDPGRAEEIFAPGPRIENFVANVGRPERQQEAARALTTLTGTLGSPSASLDDFINSLVGGSGIGVSGEATKFFRPKTSGEFSNAFNLVLDALGGRVNPVFLKDLPFQQNQLFDEFRAQAGLNPQPENTVLNFLRSRLNTARAGL